MMNNKMMKTNFTEKGVNNMGKELRLAYCNECEDLVEFVVCNEIVNEEYKGVKIKYEFGLGKCIYCGSEVATDVDYNSRKSKAKLEAYKQAIGLINLREISELLSKYDVGKEALADILGFGKVTIKRYFEGFIPSKDYSDLLLKTLNDENMFYSFFDKHSDKLKESAVKRIIYRRNVLDEIRDSKIEQISNYIIWRLGEVTPLALEKLLYFSNGVNYAMNDTQLLSDECQAWAHGPVYPVAYNKYRSFGYKPIDQMVPSTHGCLLSKLSEEEIKAIDLVIDTFGLYSPKTLELISHMQEPWLEKRKGYGENTSGNEKIDEDSVKKYFVENQLDSKKTILSYISKCVSAAY